MFTQEQRQVIGNLWLDFSVTYGRKMTRESIRLLINGVQDLPFEKVLPVLEGWMASKQATQFPMPHLIRDLISPRPDDETLARAAASRVIEAVGKFGWNNSHLARAYIGELGWVAVTRIGGWQYLCENLGSELSLTTVQAQVRDLLAAESKLDRLGMHDQPIGLPGREEAKALIESLPKLPGQGPISENKNLGDE